MIIKGLPKEYSSFVSYKVLNKVTVLTERIKFLQDFYSLSPLASEEVLRLKRRRYLILHNYFIANRPNFYPSVPVLPPGRRFSHFVKEFL